MQDFFENVKAQTKKIADTAEKITKTSIKKTSETVSVLKLKYAIKDIDSDIDNIYKELGKMVYQEYKNGAEFEGEYLEKCEKIDDFSSEIKLLNTKIAELGNKSICPECKKYNDANAKYCSFCGYEFAEE